MTSVVAELLGGVDRNGSEEVRSGGRTRTY